MTYLKLYFTLKRITKKLKKNKGYYKQQIKAHKKNYERLIL